MHSDTLAMLVPIVAIVFGIGIAGLNAFLNYRKRREIFQLHHAERMAAIEKGIEMPPLPKEFFQDGDRSDEPRRHRYRRKGLVLLFVGIALGAALWGTGDSDFWWGLLPASIGLAYLVSAGLESRDRRSTARDGAPPMP